VHLYLPTVKITCRLHADYMLVVKKFECRGIYVKITNISKYFCVVPLVRTYLIFVDLFEFTILVFRMSQKRQVHSCRNQLLKCYYFKFGKKSYLISTAYWFKPVLLCTSLPSLWDLYTVVARKYQNSLDNLSDTRYIFTIVRELLCV
jgi:hypothetical protein